MDTQEVTRKRKRDPEDAQFKKRSMEITNRTDEGSHFNNIPISYVEPIVTMPNGLDNEVMIMGEELDILQISSQLATGLRD